MRVIKLIGLLVGVSVLAIGVIFASQLIIDALKRQAAKNRIEHAESLGILDLPEHARWSGIMNKCLHLPGDFDSLHLGFFAAGGTDDQFNLPNIRAAFATGERQAMESGCGVAVVSFYHRNSLKHVNLDEYREHRRIRLAQRGYDVKTMGVPE